MGRQHRHAVMDSTRVGDSNTTSSYSHDRYMHDDDVSTISSCSSISTRHHSITSRSAPHQSTRSLCHQEHSSLRYKYSASSDRRHQQSSIYTQRRRNGNKTASGTNNKRKLFHHTSLLFLWATLALASWSAFCPEDARRLLRDLSERLFSGVCSSCKLQDFGEEATFTGSWEDLFPASRDYFGDGGGSGGDSSGGGSGGENGPTEAPASNPSGRSGGGPVEGIPNPGYTNVGYVIHLSKCPENMTSNAAVGDPVDAFYDAAAILKYHIVNAHEGVGGDLYSTTFYALVHRNAIECESEEGGTYDRVAVLEALGYWVELWGSPITEQDISSTYLRDNLDSDRGIEDLSLLNAWSFANETAAGGRNDVVVIVDWGTIMMQPPNQLYGNFMADDTQKVMYSRDYASRDTVGTGLNGGIHMGFFALKPDLNMVTTLANQYKTLDYSSTTGWVNSGVGGFSGSLGVKGLLTYIYTQTGSSSYGVELSKCLYGNTNEDPYNSIDSACRDGSGTSCSDCRAQNVSQVLIGDMMAECGSPWTCPYDAAWELSSNSLCIDYLTQWFSLRSDFESSFVTKPSNATGTFHQDIFKGYCHSQGVAGYTYMLSGYQGPPVAPTPPPTPAPTPDPTTATNSPGCTYDDSTFNLCVALQPGMSTDVASVFLTAANRWQQVITGDLSDITFAGLESSILQNFDPPQTVDSFALQECGFQPDFGDSTFDDMDICAQTQAIDGPGQVLGSAGPLGFWRGDSQLPFWGVMRFDEADMANMYANGSLEGVILHEMGHVLGVGTWWNLKGLTPSSSDTTVCDNYSGTNAMHEYQLYSGCSTAPPIETDYGTGTACGHWDEHCFGHELMTGITSSSNNPILSRLTIAGMQDLGYSVDYNQAESYSSANMDATCVCNSDRRQLRSSRNSITESSRPKQRQLSDEGFVKAMEYGMAEIVKEQAMTNGKFRSVRVILYLEDDVIHDVVVTDEITNVTVALEERRRLMRGSSSH